MQLLLQELHLQQMLASSHLASRYAVLLLLLLLLLLLSPQQAAWYFATAAVLSAEQQLLCRCEGIWSRGFVSFCSGVSTGSVSPTAAVSCDVSSAFAISPSGCCSVCSSSSAGHGAGTTGLGSRKSEKVLEKPLQLGCRS